MLISESNDTADYRAECRLCLASVMTMRMFFVLINAGTMRVTTWCWTRPRPSNLAHAAHTAADTCAPASQPGALQPAPGHNAVNNT